MHILFVTATRIGDAILSTGLLAHLIDRYPDARITVAAGPAAASLFRPMPCLEQIIVMHKRRGSLHWPALWLQCVKRRWDLVVDLRRSAIAWLLFASERRTAPPTNLSTHRVRHLAATFNLEQSPPSPICWTSESDEQHATELIPDGGPVIAVAAAANWPGKQWQADYFAVLVERLTGPTGILPNARIAIFASAQERDQVAPLLDALPATQRLNLVGRTDLPMAAAALRRCTFFVGNDSGLMHMAAAAGIPTLGLFGPSRTTHYAPWGDHTAAVRTTKSYNEIVGAPGYNRRTTGTLMDSLTVDMAENAARELWHQVVNAPLADSGVQT